MKKVLFVLLLAMVLGGSVFASDYSDPNIPKIHGGMWLWDGRKWYPAQRTASGAMIVEAEVSVGSISVDVPPSFLDSGGTASSAVLTPEGKVPVEVSASPLKVTAIEHYSATVATDTASTISGIVGSMEVGCLYLIQCRSGSLAVGGAAEDAATLRAGGHILAAGESYPIFRCGNAEGPCDATMVADGTAVATVSITVFTEQ